MARFSVLSSPQKLKLFADYPQRICAPLIPRDWYHAALLLLTSQFLYGEWSCARQRTQPRPKNRTPFLLSSVNQEREKRDVDLHFSYFPIFLVSLTKLSLLTCLLIMELVAYFYGYSLHPWGSQYSIAAFNYVETSQRLSTYCWPSAISRCLRISNTPPDSVILLLNLRIVSYWHLSTFQS